MLLQSAERKNGRTQFAPTFCILPSGLRKLARFLGAPRSSPPTGCASPFGLCEIRPYGIVHHRLGCADFSLPPSRAKRVPPPSEDGRKVRVLREAPLQSVLHGMLGFLNMQHPRCDTEVNQQGHYVYNGRNERICHNRRVKVQFFGENRQRAADKFR